MTRDELIALPTYTVVIRTKTPSLTTRGESIYRVGDLGTIVPDGFGGSRVHWHRTNSQSDPPAERIEIYKGESS